MPNFSARKGPHGGLFWHVLILTAICAVGLAWYVIERSLQEEREVMLATLDARATSLVWALEGALRVQGKTTPATLARLVEELGLQPGVAWIAVVGSDGIILADSTTSLAGKLLYTDAELATLNPSRQIQGRFSPDDPDCYETWQLLDPGRLARDKHRWENAYIFILLEVGWLKQYLQDLKKDLIFRAAILIFALLCMLALIFFIYSFRLSIRKLANIEALMEQIIASFPGALLATDLEDHITFANQKGQKLLPRPMKSLRELDCYDWDDIGKTLTAGNAVIEKNGEICQTGTPPLPISLSAVNLRDSAGKITGRLYVIRNLEQIRVLQAQLAQSEKLASIAHLAAGMAHEIRNPLSSIRGYASLLAQRIPDDILAQSTAELLCEETERINRVLSDALALAAAPKIKKIRQPVGPLLERAISLITPDLEDKEIELRIDDLTATDQEALVDGDKLVQCLLNLLINAVQAAPRGGIIRVSAKAPSADSSNWQIEIEDNGPGMSEKTRQQIFTPYFTTKACGSGLGLPITRQIIESHGGQLQAHSAPGKGASFIISLPAD